MDWAAASVCLPAHRPYSPSRLTSPHPGQHLPGQFIHRKARHETHTIACNPCLYPKHRRQCGAGTVNHLAVGGLLRHVAPGKIHRCRRRGGSDWRCHPHRWQHSGHAGRRSRGRHHWPRSGQTQISRSGSHPPNKKRCRYQFKTDPQVVSFRLVSTYFCDSGKGTELRTVLNPRALLSPWKWVKPNFNFTAGL